MKVLSIAVLSMLGSSVLANETEAEASLSEPPQTPRVQLASLDSVKLTSAYVIGGEVDLATMREDLDQRLKVELDQDLSKDSSKRD